MRDRLGNEGEGERPWHAGKIVTKNDCLFHSVRSWWNARGGQDGLAEGDAQTNERLMSTRACRHTRAAGLMRIVQRLISRGKERHTPDRTEAKGGGSAAGVRRERELFCMKMAAVRRFAAGVLAPSKHQQR